MSEPLRFPWLSLSLVALLLTAVLTWLIPDTRRARRVAIMGLLAAVLPLWPQHSLLLGI